MWELFVIKPAFIVTKAWNAGIVGKLSGSMSFSVGVDELAAVTIDAVKNGTQKRTILNGDIRAKAKELASIQK